MFDVPPPYFNFVRDVVDQWSRTRPDSLALWCVDESTHTQQQFTFRQLEEMSRRSAAFFSSLGMAKGDRVLIIAPRISQWWLAMLGLIRLGAVPIPSPTLLTHKDIEYRVRAADASAIIADEVCAPRSEGLAPIQVIVGAQRQGWTSFDSGIRESSAQFEGQLTRPDEPGIIYFTSGTTGQPKMALHTQASYGLAHRVTGKVWLDLTESDVHWALADTGWGKTAWSNLYGPWHMGACVFVLDSRTKFHPGSVLRTLEHFPITTFCAPPTAWRLIVADHTLSKHKFPRLRHCVAAGEALNAEVISGWRAATGLDIYEGYGQTESIVMIGNFKCLGGEIRPGSMGRPLPGYDVALLDEELRELPAGVPGQIALRVKPVRPLGLLGEYWRNPEETALRFRGDWYLTGDMARRDADGYYWFLGRADDVINSASYRIGPFEVESALADHPAVLESAAVSHPDKLRGEVVKAFIVLKGGRTPTEALKRELQEHCKRITAPYKYPRLIEFVDELPKTVSGKIRRVELRQKDKDEK